MKKSIKMLSLAMSTVMLAGAMSGCGKKEAVDPNLTVVTIWSGNSHSKDVMTKLYNDWNETEGKAQGIKIEYTVQGGDNLTKTLELALQNGTAPDIMGGGDMKKLAANGDILAWDDVPGGPEIIQKYKDDGVLMEGRGMYKGKTYQLPGGPGPQGMVYNKDLFKAAGIVDENGEAKPPKTWKEVREYAKILTDKSKNQYGIIAPMKWGGWFNSDITNPAMTLAGYVIYNPATDKYDVSHWKTPMETWMGMKEDGSIYPGAESLDNDSARATFAEGKIGMKFAYNFDVGVLNDQFPAKCDWGVCAYPIGEDGTAYKQREDLGWGSYMNAHTKVPLDKLVIAMQALSSDKYQTAIFEEGIGMPYDTSIIDKADTSDAKVGWVEFAKLADISAQEPRAPKTDAAGLETAGDVFLNHVWTGEISVDEGLKRIQENQEKARENYYSVHTDENSAEFADPNWKPAKQ